MKKIIVINGPAGTGKDTFIELCRQGLEPSGIPVSSFSSVDEVKQIALSMGWNGIKDEAGRQFLSMVKLASISANDGPTQYLCRKIAETVSGLIFLHIREPVEINKLKAIYPEAITLHLDRPGVERFDNYSDKSTVNYEYDAYMLNDGDLDRLAELAWQFAWILCSESNENTESEIHYGEMR